MGANRVRLAEGAARISARAIDNAGSAQRTFGRVTEDDQPLGKRHRQAKPGKRGAFAPRDGWPNPAAGPAAAGADIVLAKAQVFDTLAEAVADISHVYATTVRKRGVTKPVLTPAEAAIKIIAGPARSAILFGAERSGLDMDEVAMARASITVPINPEFASLNLAQAVILCAYEWSKHQELKSPPKVDIDPPAPQAELDGMIEHLFGQLEVRRYFFPPERMTATKQTLRNLLTKPGWNSLEVRTLRGVLSSFDKRHRKPD